ncbi:DUF2971 domain-containing protein [Bosea sp. ASV33]|uniref:DUF2971 domain-containing protein n=1 Tax=Bosea sp. ASV33 TaxID=2795106 RepID=UPI0018EC773F|nr:DUF2971 domain-containing protein [Bosea sp. ASV33]
MTLYKYYPEDRFFERRLVRFSQPSALNDPNEALPEMLIGRYSEDDYEKARREAERAGMHDATIEDLEAFFLKPFPSARFDERSFPGLWPAHEPRLKSEPFDTIAEYDHAIAIRAMELLAERANATIGIFSLSRVLSDPMRAYYANTHQGLVIGFDERHPFFAGRCLEVEHSDRPFSVSSNDGGVRVFSATFNNEDILEGRLETIPHQLFLRKRPGWEHEGEVRMIAPLTAATAVLNSADAYPVYLFVVPASAVVSIEFGYAAADDFVAATMGRVADQSVWGHLKIIRRRRLRSRMIEDEVIS